MGNLTRRDNGSRQTHTRIASEILHPHYSHSQPVVTECRPAWHENKILYYRFVLKRMIPGKVKWIEMVSVIRLKTNHFKWLVEGKSLTLEEAVQAVGQAIAEAKERSILPFFVLTKPQKRIIVYWLQYEKQHGDVPITSRGVKAAGLSDVRGLQVIKQLEEWGVMRRDDDGQYIRWCVIKEMIQHINLEE